MKVIIGLGNPGEEYRNTRHNIGFEILDKLKTEWNFPEFSAKGGPASGWEFNKKFNAEVSKSNNEILLVKPQTFMNLSGVAVKAILDFYKLSADDIIVIHDDLDIAVGKYKIAADSSSAGHNGVQNIIDALGTQKFKRIRIGIGEEKDGAPVCRLGAHDFVLNKFSSAELEKIGSIIPEIISTISKIITSN